MYTQSHNTSVFPCYFSCVCSERFLVAVSKSDSTQSLNKSDSSQKVNQAQKVENSTCVFTVSTINILLDVSVNTVYTKLNCN